ncbi:hypothetical protein, partial [Salinimicrobium marinum]|uniref:hypothetical protein n=1 Tax=Salinimicrobium marinum TaxID=680283 RepID=UPI001E306FD4
AQKITHKKSDQVKNTFLLDRFHKITSKEIVFQCPRFWPLLFYYWLPVVRTSTPVMSTMGYIPRKTGRL